VAKRYLLGGVAVAGDDWLKAADAAALLGVGTAWLGYQARAGVFPAEAMRRSDEGWREYLAGVIIALLEEAEQ